MFKRYIKNIIIVVLLCVAAVSISSYLRDVSHMQSCLKLDFQNQDFRRLEFSCNSEVIIKKAEEISQSPAELLIIAGCIYDYDFTEYNINSVSKSVFLKARNYLINRQPDEFMQFKSIYNGLLSDVKYFPVPRSNKRSEWVNYINSWDYERTYKGNRTHEGTDIMGDINTDGLYPVVSVSDGHITNIGWLELGGYRIGITSDNGIYYYYAHLDSYANDFKMGDVIKAGDIIGYMGSTGYSKVEGTSGKFPTHLHFGIYIFDTKGNEVAINPYWILKSNENKQLIYGY